MARDSNSIGITIVRTVLLVGHKETSYEIHTHPTAVTPSNHLVVECVLFITVVALRGVRTTDQRGLKAVHARARLISRNRMFHTYG